MRIKIEFDEILFMKMDQPLIVRMTNNNYRDQRFSVALFIYSVMVPVRFKLTS